MSNTHKLLIVGSSGEVSQYLQSKCIEHKLAFEVLTYDDAIQRTLTDWQQHCSDAGLTDIVLCVKSEAVPQLAAAMPTDIRVFDTSPVNRLSPDWKYYHALIDNSLNPAYRRIAVPGCFATGALAILAPLGYRGELPDRVVLDSTGGYCTIPRSSRPEQINLSMHALSREHPHAAEIKRYARINDRIPFIFHPKVGNFKRGIVTSIYLPDLSPEYAMEIYESWYHLMPHVRVTADPSSKLHFIREEMASLTIVPESQGCTVISTVDNFYHGCVIHILKACGITGL